MTQRVTQWNIQSETRYDPDDSECFYEGYSFHLYFLSTLNANPDEFWKDEFEVFLYGAYTCNGDDDNPTDGECASATASLNDENDELTDRNDILSAQLDEGYEHVIQSIQADSDPLDCGTVTYLYGDVGG
jgi:hypothetical protein